MRIEFFTQRYCRLVKRRWRLSWIIGGSKFYPPLFKLLRNLNRFAKFFTGTCWVRAEHSHGALAKIRYGEKTFAAFYEVLQHYPLEVVKEAIIRGAKSNVGIDYEYSIDEEPETLIENVEENLNKEEI